MDTKALMSQVELVTGKKYTEEQVELIDNFDKSVFCFADPGTGKTETVTIGLVNAELVKGIRPKNIIVTSFTKESKNELEKRYIKLCKSLALNPSVTFRTLDSLVYEVVHKNCHALSTERFDVDELKGSSSRPMMLEVEVLKTRVEELGMNIPINKMRGIVNAIRRLNSKMVFDRDHVENTEEFKKLRIDYEDFTTLRKLSYNDNKITKTDPHDIRKLFALEILLKDPSVSKYYKDNIDLLVVDEAQDLSLLQLKILSLLTNKLICVGDIKQQIYSFNGACTEIVQEYKKMFPDYLELKLSQSFRCADEIAEFAKTLIKKNKIGGEDFKGTGNSGIVVKEDNSSLEKVVDDISEEYYSNNKRFKKAVMFTYRNNYSAITIVDRLYKKGVPACVPYDNGRFSGYISADNLDVVDNLIGIIKCLDELYDYSHLKIWDKLIPEFKDAAREKGSGYVNPLIKIVEKTNKTFISDGSLYTFKDNTLNQIFYQSLWAAKNALDDNKPLIEVFRKLWRLYTHIHLDRMQYYYEREPEFYIKMITPLIVHKTFHQFMSDEADKLSWLRTNSEKGEGVRCLTFHKAKGTESAVVHILDADDGIVPNTKRIQETIALDCQMDAARAIRNERALVFVAATRARDELYVHYGENLSVLFDGDDGTYDALDIVYESTKENYREVDAFCELIDYCPSEKLR